MWLLIKNGDESDKRMINVDNVAFIEPDGEGSYIYFKDSTDTYVNVSYDQISKVIGEHIRSEVITIT